MSTDLFSSFPLRKRRTHECCGAGATAFAAVCCGMADGQVIWASEGWRSERINPLGLGAFCDPSRLLLVSSKDQNELLAVAEEALRSGAVPLVVMELGKPLTLTAGRRLQLAASAGAATGLSLIPEGMGSNATETRWRCEPLAGVADSTLWRWSLIKNKSGTLAAWDVRWDETTRRVTVVSETGERSGAAGEPD